MQAKLDGFLHDMHDLKLEVQEHVGVCRARRAGCM